MEFTTKETNPGVGCDVTACKYNTIDCRTFCPRGTC